MATSAWFFLCYIELRRVVHPYWPARSLFNTAAQVNISPTAGQVLIATPLSCNRILYAILHVAHVRLTPHFSFSCCFGISGHHSHELEETAGSSMKSYLGTSELRTLDSVKRPCNHCIFGSHSWRSKFVKHHRSTLLCSRKRHQGLVWITEC